MSSTPSKTPIVILGAGIGGLAAGWFLARTGRYDVTLIERAPVIGGHCASFSHAGFTLDHGPHKMYSVIPGVLDELRGLMGDRLLLHRKRNRIYLSGKLLDYPLRIENVARTLGPARCAQLGASFAKALIQEPFRPPHPSSYADFMSRRFGGAAYRMVFEPLAWKVWGDPASLHPEMARVRVPAAGASEIILKLLHLKRESSNTNAEFFHYPRKGFGDFPLAMADEIKRHGGRILVNADPFQLTREGNRVTAVQVHAGDQTLSLPCAHLISSLPLTALGGLIYPDSEPELSDALSGLRFRHLVLVYLFLKRPQVLQEHWIFFPERHFLFSRLFEQKRMSAELGPSDQTALCCDFTCSESDEIWNSSDDLLASRCAEDLARAGFIRRSEVRGFLVKRSRCFYPVYGLDYVKKMGVISRWLQQMENLLTTGRIGMYNYNNSDHCVDMGRFIVQGLLQDLPDPVIWQQLEQRVAGYKIID